MVDAANVLAVSDALLEAGALSVDVADAQAGTDRETPIFGEPGQDLELAFGSNRVVALFEPDADLPGAIEQCVRSSRLVRDARIQNHRGRRTGLGQADPESIQPDPRVRAAMDRSELAFLPESCGDQHHSRSGSCVWYGQSSDHAFVPRMAGPEFVARPHRDRLRLRLRHPGDCSGETWRCSRARCRH